MNLLYSPGAGRIYDDLGYILLGIIVESITGVAFDKYCENEIFGPLAMSETMLIPHKDLLGRIVPTEIDEDRGGLLRGIVHDERAYLMGGVAGHAGIFTTARDLGRFSRSMMGTITALGQEYCPAGACSLCGPAIGRIAKENMD